jgi:hypothetical protein
MATASTTRRPCRRRRGVAFGHQNEITAEAADAVIL